MSSVQVECPSGLSGEIRGLKGKEARLLTDRAAARRGETYDKILRGCWLSTGSPGPYSAKEDGTVDWSKVLVGDRFYALIEMRKATFGPDYTFGIQCKNSSCREHFEWDIDLNDLDIKKMSPEDRETFQNGNRFQVEIAGRTAWHKLLVGHDEQRIAKMTGGGTKEGAIINGLMVRIIEIEGIDNRDKRKFFDDMDLSDIYDLIDCLDEHDCGIDTSIEVECQECFGNQDVLLPLEGDFFYPKSRRKST